MIPARQRWGQWEGLGAALALTFLGGCDGPNETECVALVARYTELVAKSNAPRITPRDLATLKERAQERANSEAEVRKCRSQISRRGYDCAMASPNADEFEKCLLPRPY